MDSYEKSEEKGVYALTIYRICIIQKLILRGFTFYSMKDELKEKYGWDLSKHRLSKLIAIAKKSLKKRFEKDFEDDYQFVRENILRLFREVQDEDNTHHTRKEQLMYLQEFAKIAGLYEIKTKNTIDIKGDDLDGFSSLFF